MFSRGLAPDIFTLRARLVLSALVLITELVCLTIAVDTQSLVLLPGLAGLAGKFGAAGLRFLVLSVAFSLAFAAFGSKDLFAQPGLRFERRPCGKAVAIHLAAFCAFAVCSLLLCRTSAYREADTVLVMASVAGGIATILSGALAMVRASFWRELLRTAPRAPWYGVAAAGSTVMVVRELGWIWKPWLTLTFAACYRVLRLFPFDLVYDPATFTIGTRRFDVQVWAQCSGFEGMVLIFVFSAAWLGFLRREFRFPQALLMIPLGLAGSWILNVCRIVALILIGNAGAPHIAEGGFHSQAGWIAFIMLAVSLAVVFQRSSWTAVHPWARRSAPSAWATETAAYVVPFLAILAAGMLAQAASAGFEWLYPLRVLAAAIVLWKYRFTLRKLDWRAGGESVVIGIAVFLLWIGWDRLAGGARGGVPTSLAQASGGLRFGWIAFRMLGAMITVPIAEELAFRGYLLRRFVAVDFAAVTFRQANLLALLGSSAVFGLLHGGFWAPAILAGLLYAAAARRRDRIGDAAAAHAITNGLLSIWVLYTGDWHLW